MENMEDYLKKQNPILKILTYIKALFCRNLALEYHKVTPQTSLGIYMRSYTNFKHQIWTMRCFGFVLIFSVILILNIAHPRESDAATSINISGIAYQNFNAIPINGSVTSKTVQLKVNGAGAYSGEITTNNGAWAINGVNVNSGDVVTVYLDDEAEEATTVFITDETSQSNVNLYQSYVILRADTGSITNANLATGDSGDDDVKYVVSGTDISFDSGFNAYIWTGDTYTPDGSVTTQGGGDFRIGNDSVVNMNDNSMTVSGTWKNEGDYNPGLNVTTLNASSGSEMIDNSDADSVASSEFYDLNINDGGGSATIKSPYPLSVANNFTIDGGTVDMEEAQVYYLTNSSADAVVGNKRLSLTNPAGSPSGGGGCSDNSSSVSGLYCIMNPDGLSTSWLAANPTTLQKSGYMLSDNRGITGTYAAGTWTVNATASVYEGRMEYSSYRLLARLWRADTSLNNAVAITGWSTAYSLADNGATDAIFTFAGVTETVLTDQVITVEFAVRLLAPVVDNLEGQDTEVILITNEGGAKQQIQTPAFSTNVNVGGNYDNNDTFTPGKGKITFDAIDSGNTIETGGSSLYDAVFQGDGGDGTWAIQTNDMNVTNTLDVDTGDTVSINSGRVLSLDKTSGSALTLDGTISGVGRLDYKTTTTFPTTGTISSTLRLDSGAGDQIMPARAYGGDVEAYLNSATSHNVTPAAGSISISGALKLIADNTGSIGVVATNAGDITIGGDMDFTGVGAGAESIFITGNQTWTVSGNFDLTGGTLMTFAEYHLIMNGSDKTLTSNGISLENFEVSGGSVVLAGALYLHESITLSGGTFSSGGNDITVNGGWMNSGGTFSHEGAKVTFSTTDTGEIIEAGTSPFYDVEFNHIDGGWTIQSDDITVANDLNLTKATSFVVESGRTVEVQGNFVNAIAGANTTWTGSTLYLNGTSDLDLINTKTGVSDTYGTLRIGANEGIGMWNSDASTITVDSGGCLESFDHIATNGQLNIYGSCNARTNEYWAYATDFDGTDLSGGSERQANIRLSPGAAFAVDQADSLLILGQSADSNRTQISRLSTGNFGMDVAGTISARYYDFDYLNATGLNITSTATVSELSDGTFDNIGAGSSPSYISLLGLNSTDSYSNVIFDSATDGADANVVYNVNANGPAINWTFAQASGNKSGENFDREINGAQIAWTIYFSEINDGTGGDSDLTNNTTQLSANWSTATDEDIDYFAYAIGTTSGGNEVIDYTNVGVSKNFTRTGLTLSNGTTYYATVRAYNANNEVLESITSDGITVDTAVPTFSNIVITPGENSFTVSWTSNEPATSIIYWGLTDNYGNITIGDSERTTQHEVSVVGLADNTSYHFMISGTDATGNTGESADNLVTTSELENTVITNVQVANISTTSVLISWTTNHAADSKVRYGLTTDYGDEVYNSELVTSHEITISGLQPDTKYHYEILSTGNSVAI
ncbi:MAG: fibronectin type III domain-containing protein, partial [Patescibacteria group bacterium]